MSLVPTTYTTYAARSGIGSFYSSVYAYCYLNYIQCISATQVLINTYHNRGFVGWGSIISSSGSGNFYGGGVGIGSYTNIADNKTESITVTYFSQITGTVQTDVYAFDNFGSQVIQAHAGPSFTVNFITPTQPFTLVTTSGYYIVRLPAASTCIGQLFFVKNDQPSGYVAVSTISTSEAFDALSMNQLRLQLRGSCVCVTAISSTQWSILTYWSASVDYPLAYFNDSSTTAPGLSYTTITSPVVTASVDNGSVNMTLPNAATWGKGNFLMINAYQISTTPTGNSFYVHILSRARDAVLQDGPAPANQGGYNYLAFSLYVAPDLSNRSDHNASLFLVSDGTLWNVFGYFTGAGCYFDRWINGVPANGATTSGIVTHYAGGWSTTHSSTLAVNSGRLYFSKMNGATSQPFGTIIGNQGNAAIRGVIGTLYPISTNVITGSISGTTMTLNTAVIIPVGTYVNGTGVAEGTQVASQQTNPTLGGYLTSCTVNTSQTVSSTTLTFNYGWGRVYKNNPEAVNYSGFALCQVNISNTAVHFPIAMYPSFY